MKRSLALIAVLMFSFSTASHAARSTTYSDTSASAPDRVGQWDLGLFAGGAFNGDSDSTGFFGGTLAYGVTPWIALGVEAGWQEAAVSDNDDQDLGMVPILADIIVRFPNAHQTIVPYGVLGLGVIGTYVTDENGEGGNDGDDSSDTTFGWKIGAGIDWFVNERWIMNFEFAYFDSDPDLTNSIATDFSYWTLIAGLKYVY